MLSDYDYDRHVLAMCLFDCWCFEVHEVVMVVWALRFRPFAVEVTIHNANVGVLARHLKRSYGQSE
jgi:hypothetical protein